MKESAEWLVTVCAHCRRASCWLGKHYCEEYRMNGLTRVPVSQLREEARESPDHWMPEVEEHGPQ